MLSDILAIGGLAVGVIGMLELATRPHLGPARAARFEAAVRQAMREDATGTLRAEFRRSGVCPPERHLPVTLPAAFL